MLKKLFLGAAFARNLGTEVRFIATTTGPNCIINVPTVSLHCIAPGVCIHTMWLNFEQHVHVSTLDCVLNLERDEKTHLTTWHLDRLNQYELPLDGNTTRSSGGSDSLVFVIDSGVLITHEELDGKVTHGYDFVRNQVDTTPPTLEDHGTAVASLVVGKTVGIAPETHVVSIRVINDQGYGSTSDLLDALVFVDEQYVLDARTKIINLSLGYVRDYVPYSLELVIRGMYQRGFIFVVSAGNDSDDACRYSPARMEETITVGSTTIDDTLASFSNYGTCVQLYAPGVDVVGATIPSGYTTHRGTSFSAPLVAGFMAQDPGYTGRLPTVYLDTSSSSSIPMLFKLFVCILIHCVEKI